MVFLRYRHSQHHHSYRGPFRQSSESHQHHQIQDSTSWLSVFCLNHFHTSLGNIVQESGSVTQFSIPWYWEAVFSRCWGGRHQNATGQWFSTCTLKIVGGQQIISKELQEETKKSQLVSRLNWGLQRSEKLFLHGKLDRIKIKKKPESSVCH